MSSEEIKWYTANVSVARDAVESAESALLDVGATGTQYDGLRRSIDEPANVSGFFAEMPDAEIVADAVRREMSYYGIDADNLFSVTIDAVAEQDWLAGWKSHWRPTPVGKFIITPPWIEPDSDAIVIKIEPNMAFGTGTHETTQLCLEALGDVEILGRRVLDVGTGTGILAIASAKLGAEHVFACDTDAPSIDIAIENALLNDVDDKCDFAARALTAADDAADVVFANLTIDVIEPMLPLLLEKTRSELILSGILAEQQGQIIASLKANGITEPTITGKGEWIAVSIAV